MLVGPLHRLVGALHSLDRDSTLTLIRALWGSETLYAPDDDAPMAHADGHSAVSALLAGPPTSGTLGLWEAGRANSGGSLQSLDPESIQYSTS